MLDMLNLSTEMITLPSEIIDKSIYFFCFGSLLFGFVFHAASSRLARWMQRMWAWPTFKYFFVFEFLFCLYCAVVIWMAGV